MKKVLAGLTVISILSITFLACEEKGKKSDLAGSEESQLDASSLTEDTYTPGVDWKLVWSDEFEKETIDTNNWNYQVEEAGRFNDEWQRYTNSSNNAYVDDDCLVIKAIHEGDVHGMDKYTSARLNTANKHSWTYGKIAARIKLPQGKGIWPAFWMLGANINENGGDTPWPQSGEIDILELYGSKDPAVVEANIHYADQSDSHAMMGAVSYQLEQGIFADSFHIFELEWNADRIAWFVDGQQFASTPITADELSEFHKDFFIILNLAVGGTYAGRPDSTTEFPQYMYIDWVRVYKSNKM
jgi:beta-glucanase (GH16 family)